MADPGNGALDPTTGTWRAGFTLPGATGSGAEVVALAQDATHVYAGGTFSAIGGTLANNVAAWDGTQWSAMGTGFDGSPVSALAFSTDGTLYAAAFNDFLFSGGIYTWDGTTWNLLTDQIFSAVHAMVAWRDVMLVGTDSGLYVLASDGTLSNLGTSGPDSAVRAIDVIDANHLCVGGEFNTLEGGTVNANFVACWDGTAWTQLGDGLPSSVYSLTHDAAGDEIAGGYITFTDVPSADEYRAGLAILAPGAAHWVPLAGGIDGGDINNVRAMALLPDGSLLIGGDFAVAGVGLPTQVVAHHVARLSNYAITP
jgi:hypothetical protein